MNHCRICNSEEIEWENTVMLDIYEGYEVYACANCKGKFELGFQIVERRYTDRDNIFPFEKE